MTATSNARPEIVFIVAVAENGVIGAAGGIPWRQKSDMQRFKALTHRARVALEIEGAGVEQGQNPLWPRRVRSASGWRAKRLS